MFKKLLLNSTYKQAPEKTVIKTGREEYKIWSPSVNKKMHLLKKRYETFIKNKYNHVAYT